MSYYPKEENTTPAPGTEPKKFTGFEQWQLEQAAKLSADAKAFHSRTHADDDLKAHQLEEVKKYKQDK
jgi:hypothetical protein